VELQDPEEIAVDRRAAASLRVQRSKTRGSQNQEKASQFISKLSADRHGATEEESTCRRGTSEGTDLLRLEGELPEKSRFRTLAVHMEPRKGLGRLEDVEKGPWGGIPLRLAGL
jgi:hypothetical protein